MPFMGSAWQRVNLVGVERVIVSSHAFSHHLASRAAAAGIASYAYVHSPARYVWFPDHDHRGNSLVGRLGRPYFTRLDRRRVSADVSYAANSRFVADRIAEVWGVDATVIPPPVDVEKFRNAAPALSAPEESMLARLPDEFVLGASRHVRYKNLDAAIRAGEIAGIPVVLAGAGPDGQRLRAVAERASVPVIFTGHVSDAVLAELYRRTTLFVYMAVEDFGIMPVEAMACGTPVLVNEVGGARESVEATGGGVTAGWRGTDFDDPSVVSAALSVDVALAVAAVQSFSTTAFRVNLDTWLSKANPNKPLVGKIC